MRRKIAVTVPEHLMKVVEKEVAEGRASSVSAYVSDAIVEYTGSDELGAVLAEIEKESGTITEEERAWARRVLGLSS